MTDKVLAAIDSSPFSENVCDYAAWAATALDAPLDVVHVIDNHPQTSEPDLTGNLGLGTREHLLERLSDICLVPDDEIAHRSYPLLAARELLHQFIREQV
ncbi:universal stress protein, partial [Halomonas vilamensis]